MKDKMLWLIWFASAWFIVHCLLVTRDGLRDDTRLADVAVVLGNRVEPSGVPGVTLRVRLDRALALYTSGQVSQIVVSGGKGKEGFEEADVMRDDLVASGVPSHDVFVDRSGYDTWCTARATEALARENGWQSVIVVTSWYHVTRTKLAMRRFGFRDVRGAHGWIRFDLRDAYSLTREFFAFYDYWLLRSVHLSSASSSSPSNSSTDSASST